MSDTLLAPPAVPLLINVHCAVQPGDVVIPKAFEGWRWGKRAIWLTYIAPHPDPTVEGDPLSSD
jgi:hypothetical protein